MGPEDRLALCQLVARGRFAPLRPPSPEDDGPSHPQGWRGADGATAAAQPSGPTPAPVGPRPSWADLGTGSDDDPGAFRDDAPAALNDALPHALLDGSSPDRLPDPFPDARPDPLPDAPPDAWPDARPDAQPDAQAEAAADDPFPCAQPDALPDALPDDRPHVRLDAPPDAQADPAANSSSPASPDDLPDAQPGTPPNALNYASRGSLAAEWRPSLPQAERALRGPGRTAGGGVRDASDEGGELGKRPRTAERAPQELRKLVKDAWAASPETRVQWDRFTAGYRQRGKGRARPEHVPARVMLDFLSSLPARVPDTLRAVEQTAASRQELAMRVRRLQQQGGKRRAAWREHCERYGRNTLNPGWHSADFLHRFLSEHE